MERRCLEENLRLLLEKARGDVDDEGLVAHLLVAHHLREDIADGRVIPGGDGMIHEPERDLVARAQARHRFSDLALVRCLLPIQSALSNTGLRDLETRVAGRRSSLTGRWRCHQQQHAAHDRPHTSPHDSSPDRLLLLALASGDVTTRLVSRPERGDLLALSSFRRDHAGRRRLAPACRKNAASAYRPQHARGDPQPHGVSQACAAFFVQSRRHAPNGRRPSGMLATER